MKRTVRAQRPPQPGPAAPPPSQPVDATLLEGLAHVMRQHWGHDAFRPLQAEAVAATLAGGDVLVILPTGGLPARSTGGESSTALRPRLTGCAPSPA
jgi:hypothetical protein